MESERRGNRQQRFPNIALHSDSWPIRDLIERSSAIGRRWCGPKVPAHLNPPLGTASLCGARIEIVHASPTRGMRDERSMRRGNGRSQQ